MNSLNDAVRIYRHESTAPRIAIRLQGLSPNTRGIGAKIIVRGGAVPLQSQEMMCGGRYLSADDNMRVFAAGSATNVMNIEVLWRNGKNSSLTNVTANRIYEINENGAHSPVPVTSSKGSGDLDHSGGLAVEKHFPLTSIMKIHTMTFSASLCFPKN
jgi:hypothetical protein